MFRKLVMNVMTFLIDIFCNCDDKVIVKTSVTHLCFLVNNFCLSSVSFFTNFFFHFPFKNEIRLVVQCIPIDWKQSKTQVNILIQRLHIFEINFCSHVRENTKNAHKSTNTWSNFCKLLHLVQNHFRIKSKT